MSDFEITALVLSEHEAMRREFAALDAAEGAEELAAAWSALAARLEVHAAAEELLFYPLLADAGQHGRQETEDGVREHNGIRAAVRAVDGPAGGDGWWQAVRTAQEVNAEHMAEEEREFVSDFRSAVPAGRREELGMQWLAFHDEHERAHGLSGQDADPQAVAAADVPAAVEPA